MNEAKCTRNPDGRGGTAVIDCYSKPVSEQGNVLCTLEAANMATAWGGQYNMSDLEEPFPELIPLDKDGNELVGPATENGSLALPGEAVATRGIFRLAKSI